MNANFSLAEIVRVDDAAALLAKVAAELSDGTVVPYLGPGVLEAAAPAFPTSPEALAAFFAGKVALPKRAKGNAWASAQHIESTKHRATVTALMAEAFAPRIAPTALHAHLAGLDLPMIVDTWYDATMRDALTGRAGWGEVQGITRAGIGEDRWYRFYDASGAETDRAAAQGFSTLLYKPHGAIAPAKNFLISDADYVEVLTEIDIQTPIPEAVKDRRTDRTFLFLGCRFHDQLLRTYARQLTKRSADTHYAVVDPSVLTRNELRFLATHAITPLALSMDEATRIILAATTPA